MRTEYNELNAIKHLHKAGFSNTLNMHRSSYRKTSGILNVSSRDQCMLRAFDDFVGYGLVCGFFTNTRSEERREVKVVRCHGERRGEYLWAENWCAREEKSLEWCCAEAVQTTCGRWWCGQERVRELKRWHLNESRDKMRRSSPDQGTVAIQDPIKDTNPRYSVGCSAPLGCSHGKCAIYSLNPCTKMTSIHLYKLKTRTSASSCTVLGD